ncbi:Uncharacterised protein [Pantoea agglomerans]|uniref:Uncharacterized protein n=1 Tax=Enterobacter agglomerans TaxID=549 RepID=A0A379AM33_ENTAG|nr:Uncharacterised protein [Pantoea agglomerans]
MSLYLSAALASNRKGRFLQTVAGATPLTKDWISSPPASGLLIVQAEELTDANTMQHLYHWAMQAGCAALVINLKAEQFTLLAQLPSPTGLAISFSGFEDARTGANRFANQ